MLYYLKRLYSTPFRIVLIKLFNKIIVFLNNLINRRIDFINKNTHINFNVPIIKTSYIDIKNLDVSNIDLDVAKYLSKMYIDHKFDLLGSGWVKNSYDSAALGLEGYKYYMNVAAPASAPEGYEPIDWQKDFKSGFRWNEKKWYKDQRIADKLGSDIKVPWELTRLQHLPQLAIFAIMDSDLKEQNLIEFKNQILDFIKHNPPRMGVNWTCTMDVGIRVANMLVAYDMFSQMDGDKNLDENLNKNELQCKKKAVDFYVKPIKRECDFYTQEELFFMLKNGLIDTQTLLKSVCASKFKNTRPLIAFPFDKEKIIAYDDETIVKFQCFSVFGDEIYMKIEDRYEKLKNGAVKKLKMRTGSHKIGCLDEMSNFSESSYEVVRF